MKELRNLNARCVFMQLTRRGGRHGVEGMVLNTMEVNGAIVWNCQKLNSVEFHGIVRLPITRWTPSNVMEFPKLLRSNHPSLKES